MRFSSSLKPPDRLCRQPCPLFSAYWGSLPGVKQLQHEVDRSLWFSAEVRNKWSYMCTLPLCLHALHRDDFTFNSYAQVWSKLHSEIHVISVTTITGGWWEFYYDLQVQNFMKIQLVILKILHIKRQNCWTRFCNFILWKCLTPIIFVMTIVIPCSFAIFLYFFSWKCQNAFENFVLKIMCAGLLERLSSML
jgi:hypothetical protein